MQVIALYFEGVDGGRGKYSITIQIVPIEFWISIWPKMPIPNSVCKVINAIIKKKKKKHWNAIKQSKYTLNKFRAHEIKNRKRIIKALYCFLSTPPRCIITGMASGSIVLFYNDFNRWHHEYQTRYWAAVSNDLTKIQTFASVNSYQRHYSISWMYLKGRRNLSCYSRRFKLFLKRALLYFVDQIGNFHINHRVGVMLLYGWNRSIFSCKSLFSSPLVKKRGVCGELAWRKNPNICVL